MNIYDRNYLTVLYSSTSKKKFVSFMIILFGDNNNKSKKIRNQEISL